MFEDGGGWLKRGYAHDSSKSNASRSRAIPGSVANGLAGTFLKSAHIELLRWSSAAPAG